MRQLILLAFLVLLVSTETLGAKITTTEALVQAMQKKYAKSWYQTATFVQKTTNIDKDGNKKVETWYEAMSVPGSLRIDFTPIKDGNGILFTNYQLYTFKGGKVDVNRPYVHPLMILGFDIYRMPMADAIEKLKGLKFDLSIEREDIWQGRPVYVVGAKQGDLRRSSGSIGRTFISCGWFAPAAAMARRLRRHNSTSTRSWAAAGCRRKLSSWLTARP
jgi:outer membrane lipoprotein-sorting protein